jgi:two-component system, chemotaxis family, chemotaxis protein CheY
LQINGNEGSRKILVVDDDADWRSAIGECVRDLGYEAVEVASGREALEYIAKDDCSIVLLDLYMPEMSGRQVVERLPEDHPQVVFMTCADVEEIGPALSTGAHYYLPKGANQEQLSLMLRSLQSVEDRSKCN